ncbi:cysteine dioxygenase family protein [Cellulomonas sp. URHE0023]|uniref:cysteine dioxygenase n=1 Tax=Cellulomonas sp. URHE0023 TaxID=1380354 RepID=UPI00068F0BCF|nr:cysteine dioxygenase family protein [Cellulomonas sp. URHE0023]
MTQLSAPPVLDVHELSALTRSIAASPELWRPRVRFQESGRWWTRLDAPAGVDVWLITWLPAQGTELHDHGASSAAFTIASGTITEIRPTADGGLVPRRFAAGQTQTVDPGDLHDVLNAGTEPAVTIHAYSVPLTRMTYWARSGDGVLVPARTVETDEPEST